jgi:Spy/CpxP family protein refolding chaperone
MMSIRRTACFSALPLAAFVALGCQGATTSTSGGEAVGAESAAIVAEGPSAAKIAARDAKRPAGERGRPGHRMGPPGPAHLVDLALRELDLTAAQRSAIEAARPEEPKHAGKHRGEALFATLASAVRAGSVDPAAIVAAAPREPADAAEHRAAAASALTTLHAALEPAQRRALVDLAEKRLREHAPKGPPPEMREGRQGHGGPMAHLVEGLGLSEAQKAEVDAALAASRPAMPDPAQMKPRFEAMAREMRARLETFASDAFDAKAFVEPPKDAPDFGPRAHLEHLAKGLAAVVPVLTPAQREALAQKLEKGPPAHDRMGPPPGEHEDCDEPAPPDAAR